MSDSTVLQLTERHFIMMILIKKYRLQKSVLCMKHERGKAMYWYEKYVTLCFGCFEDYCTELNY
jgi:hypothetical protein